MEAKKVHPSKRHLVTRGKVQAMRRWETENADCYDSGFRDGHRESLNKLRALRKRNRELKKKVDKLHSTIGFLLTQ